MPELRPSNDHYGSRHHDLAGDRITSRKFSDAQTTVMWMFTRPVPPPLRPRMRYIHLRDQGTMKTTWTFIGVRSGRCGEVRAGQRVVKLDPASIFEHGDSLVLLEGQAQFLLPIRGIMNERICAERGYVAVASR